jgi:hypothetical protein
MSLCFPIDALASLFARKYPSVLIALEAGLASWVDRINAAWRKVPTLARARMATMQVLTGYSSVWLMLSLIYELIIDMYFFINMMGFKSYGSEEANNVTIFL